MSTTQRIAPEAHIGPEQASLFWNAYGRTLKTDYLLETDETERASVHMEDDPRFLSYVQAAMDASDYTDWQQAAILTFAQDQHKQAYIALRDRIEHTSGDASYQSEAIYSLAENPDAQIMADALGEIAKPLDGLPYALPEEPVFLQAYAALQKNNPELAPYVTSHSDYLKHVKAAYKDMAVPLKIKADMDAMKDRFAAGDKIDRHDSDLMAQAESFYADIDKGIFPGVANAPSEPSPLDFISDPADEQDPIIVSAIQPDQTEITPTPITPDAAPTLSDDFTPSADSLIAEAAFTTDVSRAKIFAVDEVNIASLSTSFNQTFYPEGMMSIYPTPEPVADTETRPVEIAVTEEPPSFGVKVPDAVPIPSSKPEIKSNGGTTHINGQAISFQSNVDEAERFQPITAKVHGSLTETVRAAIEDTYGVELSGKEAYRLALSVAEDNGIKNANRISAGHEITINYTPPAPFNV